MEAVAKEMENLLIEGRYLLSKKNLAQAEICLESALKLFHQNESTPHAMTLAASASLILGQIYELQEQWEKAFFYIKQATKLAPGRADAWLFLAQISFYLANKLKHTYLWNKACEDLNTVLKLDDTLKPAVKRLMLQYGIKKEAV